MYRKRVKATTYRRRRLQIERLERRDLLTGPLPAEGEPNYPYRLSGANFSPYITPGENPNLGAGQITEVELRQRIAAIAQYTNSIRSFGCTGDLRKTGSIAHELGMTVAIGAWISRDLAANQREIDCLVDEASRGNVDLAIVGSESLLRGDVSPNLLVGYLVDVRDRIRAAGVSIPVATADVYNVLLSHPEVVAAGDVVLPNYYPFWEGRSVESAVAALHRANQQIITLAGAKQIIISETGWPSQGDPIGLAAPSPENAAYYFQNFVSWARAEHVDYYYFEAYDEAWKIQEGERGRHWGILFADQTLKPGMERVFNGETTADNWTNPQAGTPIIDVFSLPATVTTNVDTFVMAGTTEPANVVKLNGNPIPGTSIDSSGNFTVPVALVPGTNTLEIMIESSAGEVVRATTVQVVFDPSYSTRNRRLVYVDVVPGESPTPMLNGTVLIDPDAKAVLGILTGEHIRGISRDGHEIYMADRSVLSTATHQLIRTLPFSQEIPWSGFLVSPTGDRLYSRNEVVDVLANTLETTFLPLVITTGSSWSGASIPGGPAVSPDGTTIYANKPVTRINVADRTTSPTKMSGTLAFISDIEITPDGSRLLISNYGGPGRVDIYDTSTEQLLASLPTGDFSGEIALSADGTKVIVGISGNPQLGGGGIVAYDIATKRLTGSLSSIPLADNLTISALDELFVSSGAVDELNGSRLGIDVIDLSSDGKLTLKETYFLGINRNVRTFGRPQNDQIRRIVYKSAPLLSLDVEQGSMSEKGGAIIATVTRTNADMSQPLVVMLTSSDISEATVPATVTISANQSSETFTIAAVDDSQLDGAQSVTIAASAAGVVEVSQRILVDDDESAWRNPRDERDVNDDGFVVPLDVLLIINELNFPKYMDAQGKLPTERVSGGLFYDVNGDRFASAVDALVIVNYLNSGVVVSAEGEPTARIRQSDTQPRFGLWIEEPAFSRGEFLETIPSKGTNAGLMLRCRSGRRAIFDPLQMDFEEIMDEIAADVGLAARRTV